LGITLATAPELQVLFLTFEGPPVKSMPAPSSPADRSTIHWRGHALRGILFDMDGVIADTRQAHLEAWLEFGRIEGVEIEPEAFMARTFGRGNMQVLEEFFPGRMHDIPFILGKSDEKEGLFLRQLHAGRVAAVPGVVEFIRAARDRGIALAVGSSAPRGNIDAVLAYWGIADAFPVIVSMNDVTHAKPDPEIFLLAAKRLGIPPGDCLVLEDSLHGLDAGRRAGCAVIGVTTMHSPAEIAHRCDATAPDFHEIARMLFG